MADPRMPRLTRAQMMKIAERQARDFPPLPPPPPLERQGRAIGNMAQQGGPMDVIKQKMQEAMKAARNAPDKGLGKVPFGRFPGFVDEMQEELRRDHPPGWGPEFEELPDFDPPQPSMEPPIVDRKFLEGLGKQFGGGDKGQMERDSNAREDDLKRQDRQMRAQGLQKGIMEGKPALLPQTPAPKTPMELIIGDTVRKLNEFFKLAKPPDQQRLRNTGDYPNRT